LIGSFCDRQGTGHRAGQKPHPTPFGNRVTMPTKALAAVAPENQIAQGDCVELMGRWPSAIVDLAFADPPFNIGYEYDAYEDRLAADEYLQWSRRWLGEVHRLLRDDGSFWLAIGDEYAAQLRMLSGEIGFHLRSWVIWYYTFGVHCRKKFTRSHAHLFHFVKHPERFTFNDEQIRVPSARQLVYNDARANPRGRTPDDTWILRPQDLTDGFNPDEDIWYFPRVAGTFNERAGYHGCQMPEQLLARIIRTSSQPGELVFDPFGGSASTLVVAKKLGRRWLGCELSENYAERGAARLESIAVGDPLEGAAEPKVSAPATPVEGGKKSRRPASAARRPSMASQRGFLFDPLGDSELRSELRKIYAGCYSGHSLERVLLDPELQQKLCDACQGRSLLGNPEQWFRELFAMRSTGQLVDLPLLRVTDLPWARCRGWVHGSEIAWHGLAQREGLGLDELLCRADLMRSFDQIAGRVAPGHTPLEYRWAALKLRQARRAALPAARARTAPLLEPRPLPAASLDPRSPASAISLSEVPASAGVWGFWSGAQPLLIAAAQDLRASLAQQLHHPETRRWWLEQSPPTAVAWTAELDGHPTGISGALAAIEQWRPLFNLPPDQSTDGDFASLGDRATSTDDGPSIT
jgi:site-specific DNA-methyltransferase (adenine-specific)